MAEEFSTLVELYERSVDRFANNDLFGVKTDGRYVYQTYAAFGEQVDAARAALAAIGVGAGDTVTVVANNRVEWAVAAYATYGRGAAFCPMYESQTAEEREYIARDSGTKVLLAASEELYAEMRPWVDSIDSLERVLYFDGAPDGEDCWAKVVGAHAGTSGEKIAPSPGDLAGFIYTSGTTGKPKGVLLSHANLVSNIRGVLSYDLIRETDVSLAFLPWAHVFGQNCELHPMFAIGATMGLVENVTTIIANLSEVRPTILFAVPRIFNRIYDGVQKKMADEPPIKQALFARAMKNSDALRTQKESGGAGFLASTADKLYDKLVFSKVRERFGGRLRYCISGGAALAPEVARFIDNLHIEVYEGYGLTETSPLISVNYPGHRKIGSVGKTVPNMSVEIADVEGYPAGVGELCVRGPNVMMGYHNLPEQTDDVIDETPTGRLFHTGDLGRVDDDGYVWILGRVKEQYKLENGKYVVPAPIEEQISLSPYIIQAMLEGTNKPYNVAVIVVDKPALEKWAAEHGVPSEGLLENEKVHALYAEEIERVAGSMKRYERPKKFRLTEEEWTPENGMLTPKMSLKRRVVMEKFADDIRDLYAS